MTAHTPGPWKAEGTCVYALNGDRSNIFFCGVQGGYTEQNRHRSVRTKCDELLANARLIAAAPELLEALELCEEALEDGHWSNLKALVRDAIAKAKGEQP